MNKCKDPRGHRFSEEVKKFALTLHFYSPRAYTFVRSLFALPCISSLSNWSSSIDCSPGFFKDVFSYIQQKGLEDNTYKDCALIFDSMHIKSGLVYNPSTGNYEGFSDYGNNISAFDPNIIATEALVFMLVGLRGHWKCPIGYVLCEKISTTNLVCLLTKAINLCIQHGIDVHSVTCDGAFSNFSAMKSLGCSFDKVENMKTHFNIESYDKVIYFIPDPCHMLKLARNALCDLGLFIDSQKRFVKWEHITVLQNLQEDIGLKFANKLGNSHINFHRQKMNVKITAQTLSNSVADAIEFLMLSGHPSFHDAQGTLDFIRTINQLFDLLNSRSPFGKDLKKPLFLNDKIHWFNVIEKSIKYLSNLTDKYGTKILNHRRKTFVVGFIVSAKSIRDLSNNLLSRSEKSFKYVLTYKMSQDHLELLFACIRGKNGFNNNPNIIQLKASIKKILLRNFLIGSSMQIASLLKKIQLVQYFH